MGMGREAQAGKQANREGGKEAEREGGREVSRWVSRQMFFVDVVKWRDRK